MGRPDVVKTRDFRQNLRFSPKSEIFAEIRDFHRNPRFSPKSKIFVEIPFDFVTPAKVFFSVGGGLGGLAPPVKFGGVWGGFAPPAKFGGVWGGFAPPVSFIVVEFDVLRL